MDALFGGFWPEPGVPGKRPASCWRPRRSGVLAGDRAVPFRDLGLGDLPRPAGRRWRRARGGSASPATTRSPWPAPRCASRWRRPSFVRDAEWIVVLCVLAGAAVCVAGLVNGRTLPALRAGRGRRGRWPACAASRGSAARCSRSPAWAAARPRCARPRWSRAGACSCSACCSPRRTRCSPSGSDVAGPRPRASTRSWLRAFVTVVRRRRRARRRRTSRLNPPAVEPRRRPDPPGGAALRVAGPGAARRRGLRRVPGRAGHGDLRRATTTSSGRPG